MKRDDKFKISKEVKHFMATIKNVRERNVYKNIMIEAECSKAEARIQQLKKDDSKNE